MRSRVLIEEGLCPDVGINVIIIILLKYYLSMWKCVRLMSDERFFLVVVGWSDMIIKDVPSIATHNDNTVWYGSTSTYAICLLIDNMLNVGCVRLVLLFCLMLTDHHQLQQRLWWGDVCVCVCLLSKYYRRDCIEHIRSMGLAYVMAMATIIATLDCGNYVDKAAGRLGVTASICDDKQR